uniref:Actin binding Rho activating protein b n=1 Tax=Neogobius melanostomus TaxID=47308 RepID=A0A8C6T4B2_9GOBI
MNCALVNQSMNESLEGGGEGGQRRYGNKLITPNPSPYFRFKKEAEDGNKINALFKNYSAVGSLKSWASEHTVNQKLNPFSGYFDYDYSMSTRLQRGQEGYGRPKEGTKTAERVKRADLNTGDFFGELFDRYFRISDKVVGILMRARKHGKLEEDGVIITLLV